jgi:hypothetical protein
MHSTDLHFHVYLIRSSVSVVSYSLLLYIKTTFLICKVPKITMLFTNAVFKTHATL